MVRRITDREEIELTDELCFVLEQNVWRNTTKVIFNNNFTLSQCHRNSVLISFKLLVKTCVCQSYFLHLHWITIINVFWIWNIQRCMYKVYCYIYRTYGWTVKEFFCWVNSRFWSLWKNKKVFLPLWTIPLHS